MKNGGSFYSFFVNVDQGVYPKDCCCWPMWFRWVTAQARELTDKDLSKLLEARQLCPRIWMDIGAMQMVMRYQRYHFRGSELIEDIEALRVVG